MRRIIGLIFLSVALSSGAFGQDVVTDPIHDYLFSRDDNRDLSMPDLQRIVVRQVDINNDGNPVTFITFNGYGGKQGNWWTAYEPVNGGYVRVRDPDDDFFFRPDTFYVGNVGGTDTYGLLAYISGNNGGDLELYQIRNGRVIKTDEGSLDLSKQADAAEFQKYFGSASNWKSMKVSPQKVLSLADLRKAGYDVDKAIKEANEANNPSTTTATPMPQAAPSLSSTHSAPISVQQQRSEGVATPTPKPAPKETPSKFFWVIPGAIVAAVVVGVAFFVTRTSPRSRRRDGLE